MARKDSSALVWIIFIILALASYYAYSEYQKESTQQGFIKVRIYDANLNKIAESGFTSFSTVKFESNATPYEKIEYIDFIVTVKNVGEIPVENARLSDGIPSSLNEALPSINTSIPIGDQYTFTTNKINISNLNGTYEYILSVKWDYKKLFMTKFGEKRGGLELYISPDVVIVNTTIGNNTINITDE